MDINLIGNCRERLRAFVFTPIIQGHTDSANCTNQNSIVYDIDSLSIVMYSIKDKLYDFHLPNFTPWSQANTSTLHVRFIADSVRFQGPPRKDRKSLIFFSSRNAYVNTTHASFSKQKIFWLFFGTYTIPSKQSSFSNFSSSTFTLESFFLTSSATS